MDQLFLSRLQFAITAGFHFLFVPMTLGVVVVIAVMQTFYYKNLNEAYLKLIKFFGKLFLINFTIGVVTGISLEFQFGMNWAQYSKYVGDIFGVPLAIEATMAFFLESSFLGLWIFGWDRISKKIHLLSIWMVAFGSTISAMWILFANAFMQHPVGYQINNGRVELTDFFAFMSNSYGWVKFFHTIFSSYLTGAFFVMAVSAYQILKKKDYRFKISFKIAAYLALFSSFMIILFGDFHAKDIYKYQPSKFAAMESIWENKKSAAYPLLLLPDEKNERNIIEAIKIPYFLSILAAYDINAEIKGLKSFNREDRPPVFLTFLSFRTMVLLGFLFVLISLFAAWISYKDETEKYSLFLKLVLYSSILPYLGMQFGWIVSEVGRQPWSVYGLLRTADSLSKSLTLNQIIISLLGYLIIYSLIGAVGFYLIFKNAKKEV
jgi:cytochrome d ubiquinol oxidase subunit I